MILVADVKWIKIVTDIFDDDKILLIESMPEADSIIVIWFKLLCLAGKQNNSGVFLLNGRIPFTDEMFATIFRRPLNTVRLALKTFEQFGMIEIINDTVTIPKWEKHQKLDALEASREATKLRVRRYRDKQKQLTDGCNVTVTSSNADRIDKNREDKSIEDKNTSYSCPEPSKDASTPPVYTLPLNDGTNHEITSEDYEKYKRLYPSVDVMAEFRKMDGWFDGHPSRRKTRKGIRRFINSWLGKEQDNGGTKHNSVSTTPPPPPPKVVPKPVQAPTPPAQDEEPKNVRRQVTLKDDDNRLVGFLYEDGEIVVIRKEGRFTHADVGPFGMKRINISGYRSVKRWEDATCDPGTQLSDFFP